MLKSLGSSNCIISIDLSSSSLIGSSANSTVIELLYFGYVILSSEFLFVSFHFYPSINTLYVMKHCLHALLTSWSSVSFVLGACVSCLLGSHWYLVPPWQLLLPVFNLVYCYHILRYYICHHFLLLLKSGYFK